MYRYEMIAKDQESPVERQLAELAAEAAVIRLQIDDIPEVRFITESSDGYVRFAQRVDGYCATGGKYICVLRGLTPKAVVLTTIHEVKHAHQCQSANRYKLSARARERDAELFTYELFGTHSNNGDAPTLTRTLNKILQEDSDRLWKEVCRAFREKERIVAAKPHTRQHEDIEESDAIRRKFAPILKARAEAVRQVIDPSRQRLFPANIEFSSPQPGLKLSYQK